MKKSLQTLTLRRQSNPDQHRQPNLDKTIIIDQKYQMLKQVIKSTLQLLERSVINHDCILARFRYVGPVIPLKLGNHLVFKMFIKTLQHPEGELVRKKYTPISPASQTEYLDFLFKIYRPNEHPNFPEGGKMTPYLERLKVGDLIDVEGPVSRFAYRKGFAKLHDQQEFPIKKLVLVAGGSGLAPIYNVVSEIILDETDPLEIVLLFANKSQADIVLKDEIQKMSKRVKVHYIIDKALEPEWKGFTGYVTKDVMQKICPLGQEGTLYCSCGPFPMNEIVKNIILDNPGSRYFKF